jgi:hypothetical protein
MSSLVIGDLPSLPMSCTANMHEHHCYFDPNMILYLTVISIVANSIYSMLIYNEVRRLRRDAQQAEHNMIHGGRLLYNVNVNMRECLTKLLNLLYPHNMKTIAYEDM